MKKNLLLRWRTPLLLAALLVFASTQALASSAVAFNPETGVWRLASGYNTAEIAASWALAGCNKASRGRGNCVIITSCQEGGYLQIMVGLGANNRQAGVVAACGYSSIGFLNHRIRNYCDAWVSGAWRGRATRCKTVKRWYDAANDENVPPKCMNAHPSRDPCYEWPYPLDWY